MPTFLKLALSLLLTGVTVCTAAQTMYRCGSTYSQTPCGAEQKKIEMKTDDPCELEGNKYSSTCIMRPSKPYSSQPSNSNSSYSPELEKLRKNYLQAKKEADEAITRHCAGKSILGPIIGMSEADLSCIEKYRQPEKVNTTTTAAGESKQYIFRDHGRATYLYFRAGTLTSIQAEQ